MSKQPFNFRSGIVDKSTVKIAVYSLSNQTATITIDGSSYTPTLVGIGTDGVGGATDSGDGGAPAIYVGVQTVTNLKGWTDFTVTQSNTTLQGRTTPDQGDVKQEIYCITCDNKKSLSGGVGSWAAMEAYSRDPKSNVTCLIHTDDHGYIDSLVVNDTSLSGLFLSSTPEALGSVYAYSLAYAAYLGLIDGDENDSGYSPDFQNTNRIYCWHNIPMWTQVGDHEVGNNPEEDGDRSASDLANATAAFRDTIGAINTYINTANSLAWVRNVGNLEVVSYDRLSALPANTSLYNNILELNTIANNVWLGAAQILDIKNSLGGTQPYILIAASAGLKHMSGPNWRRTQQTKGWSNTAWLGAQQPIHDYTSDINKDSAGGDDAVATTSEMLSLFTLKGTPMSIMQKAASYNAKVLMYHGDTHVPRDNYFFTPESDAHAELEVRELGSGAVNLRASHRLHPIFKAGYTYKGSANLWNADWTVQDLATSNSEVAISSYLTLYLKPEGKAITAVTYSAEGSISGEIIRNVTIPNTGSPKESKHLRGGWT